MERFEKLYPFTTENIAGYMKDLELQNKKVCTVTGSGDQVLNAISKGCLDITTFDVNFLTQYYLNLKLAACQKLTYEEFLRFLLYPTSDILDYQIFRELDLDDTTRDFFERKYYECNYSGEVLRNSSLFVQPYFNYQSKLFENVYLEKESYQKLQDNSKEARVQFLCQNLLDLEVYSECDYLFLSNISDYLNLLFDSNVLEQYRDLLEKFGCVKNIYFAYLYDVFGRVKRSRIDCLDEVYQIWRDAELQTFPTALEGVSDDIKDGVLILKKE